MRLWWCLVCARQWYPGEKTLYFNEIMMISWWENITFQWDYDDVWFVLDNDILVRKHYISMRLWWCLVCARQWYPGEKTLHFNEIMMMSGLCLTMISWWENITFQWDYDDVWFVLDNDILVRKHYISMRLWWCLVCARQWYPGEKTLHFNEIMMMSGLC